MIQVYSIKTSSRLEYIAGILFKELLGLDFEIITVDAHSDFDFLKQVRTPAVLYGMRFPGLISIPSEGLLFEEGIRKLSPVIVEATPARLQFSDAEFKGFDVDFDILSAAFYLVTEYHFYTADTFDEHGRYKENEHPLFLGGHFGKCLVDSYASMLFDLLESRHQNLETKEPIFDYTISFDIDAPYLYKHKGLIVTAGSIVKKIIRADFNGLIHQIKSLSGGEDPYDMFADILETCPKDKLIFFFLISGGHKHDGRTTYKSKAYRSLMQRITDSGIKTGIHPSYTSFLNREQIDFEVNKLSLIVGKDIRQSRMHFLKYRLPQTFESLIAAGITDDYSLCLLHNTGFRNFIARPVKWFNLTKNSETNLTLHPTIVMDRSLQKYMGLTPGEAWDSIKKAIDITQSFNGHFTILFHNNTLSETGDWKGWLEVYNKTIQYLR